MSFESLRNEAADSRSRGEYKYKYVGGHCAQSNFRYLAEHLPAHSISPAAYLSAAYMKVCLEEKSLLILTAAMFKYWLRARYLQMSQLLEREEAGNSGTRVHQPTILEDNECYIK